MSQTPDPYRIPLTTAQDWVKNWLDFKPAVPQADGRVSTAEMRAFAFKKTDLQDLMAQADDADYIRFYIGLHDKNDKKIPHLLVVNATMAPDPKHPGLFYLKDLISDDEGADLATVAYPVNDASHVCPPFCDPESALNT